MRHFYVDSPLLLQSGCQSSFSDKNEILKKLILVYQNVISHMSGIPEYELNKTEYSEYLTQFLYSPLGAKYKVSNLVW